MAIRSAWTIRPYPHNTYRMHEFVSNGMAAIGWPRTGDLTGCDREAIRKKLREAHYPSASPQRVGAATGTVHRFVNRIQLGDAVAVPDGDVVYFGVVDSPYEFHSELQADDKGYPHWIGVDYNFDRRPVERLELPAVLFDSLKAQLAVYALPAQEVWDVINNPARYSPVDPGVAQETRLRYAKALSEGTVPGMSSPRFEEAVLKVLSFYYPKLTRLGTREAPEGADTDLMTSLPGDIVVRVQVKCYQDDRGVLGPEAVDQLRNSMDPGEHGILVTTGQIGRPAYDDAESDPERPIGLISGGEFVELVFENQEDLDDQDLWALGLRWVVVVR